MRQIVVNACTELGKELYEAQQGLASHNKYKGVFEKWYTSLGFSKRTVYDYIGYYNVVRQAHEIGAEVDLDSLPKKLIYAIGAKSSESTPAKAQAKSEVLAGDIATLKENGHRCRIWGLPLCTK